MFSAANGLILTSSRVYYAMAADGLFFRKLAEVHPRFQTPAFAVVSSSVWAAILAISGTFEQLLTYVVFSSWIFYALGAASLFVYRRRHPANRLAYGVPGYPWTPAVFIFVALALVVNTIIGQPSRAGVGLLLIASGLPGFFVWRKWNTSVQRESAGPVGGQSGTPI
jgi:APA family basic amino acid/polyamine antiporter